MALNQKCFRKSLKRDWSDIKRPIIYSIIGIILIYLIYIFKDQMYHNTIITIDFIFNIIKNIPISASLLTLGCVFLIISMFIRLIDKNHVKSTSCRLDICVVVGMAFIAMLALTTVYGMWMYSNNVPDNDRFTYLVETMTGFIPLAVLIATITPVWRAYVLCNNEPDEIKESDNGTS